MAGAQAGARFGMSQIPPQRQPVEGRENLIELADRMASQVLD